MTEDRYVYPDLVIVCGEPRFEDEHVDTLLDPTLIIEVLSHSTENHDRGSKFAQNHRIESLREYVLVAQDQPHVERYTRQPEGGWLLPETEGVDATAGLASVGCTLKLADVYERVGFPAASSG